MICVTRARGFCAVATDVIAHTMYALRATSEQAQFGSEGAPVDDAIMRTGPRQTMSGLICPKRSFSRRLFSCRWFGARSLRKRTGVAEAF